MKLEITEEQREHLYSILRTHLHNMQSEAIKAHDVDPQRYAFYSERVGRTEALLPIFVLPENTTTDDEDENDVDEEI